MTTLGWILLAMICAVAVIAALQWSNRRGQYRSLASRRPDRGAMGQNPGVPLGMEATDLELVNRVSRRNDALERTAMVGQSRTRTSGSFTAQASTHVAPMPEDETYARRFHSAFQRSKDKTDE